MLSTMPGARSSRCSGIASGAIFSGFGRIFLAFFRDLDELTNEVEGFDFRSLSFFPRFDLIRSDGFGDFIVLGPSPVTSEEYRFPKNLPQK